MNVLEITPFQFLDFLRKRLYGKEKTMTMYQALQWCVIHVNSHLSTKVPEKKLRQFIYASLKSESVCKEIAKHIEQNFSNGGKR